MKKALPFVFPVAALLLVAFLAFRWYGQRTERTGEITEFGEGIAIEELSGSELDSVIKGTGDYKSVTMTGSDEAMGTIRYEIADGKVRFSVNADLPELESGMYQVWLKATDSEAIRKAFVLDQSKAGFMGSASISAETLPFEVVVTRELSDDATPEQEVLKGTISN